MKIKLFLFLPLGWMFVQCGQAQSTRSISQLSADSIVLSNRANAKQYFLCKCIDQGFPEAELLKKNDHSIGILVEMMSYEPRVFKKLDSLANNVVSKIPVSNLTKKRGIMTICIDYYNGKELDDFVRSIDNRISR